MKKVTLYEVVTKEIIVEDLEHYVRHYQTQLERNKFIEPYESAITEVCMTEHTLPVRSFFHYNGLNSNKLYVASTEDMCDLVFKVTGVTWEDIDDIKETNENLKRLNKDLTIYRSKVNNLNFIGRLKYLFTTNIK